jgi:hypothetical protein
MIRSRRFARSLLSTLIPVPPGQSASPVAIPTGCSRTLLLLVGEPPNAHGLARVPPSQHGHASEFAPVSPERPGPVLPALPRPRR